MTDSPISRLDHIARDPRVNPVAGDVLKNNVGWTRRVELITARVRYISDQGRHLSCSFETWRKWAAGAEIVRRGDE